MHPRLYFQRILNYCLIFYKTIFCYLSKLMVHFRHINTESLRVVWVWVGGKRLYYIQSVDVLSMGMLVIFGMKNCCDFRLFSAFFQRGNFSFPKPVSITACKLLLLHCGFSISSKHIQIQYLRVRCALYVFLTFLTRELTLYHGG